MSELLRRHWFLAGLALVVTAGLVFPAGGVRLREIGFLPVLTAVSLFISGLSLDTSRLAEGVDARGVVLGLASTYLVAPALAYPLALAGGPPVGGPESEGYRFLEAMMIVAAQAGTIASAPALTLVAGGNQALALLITLGSNTLTAFVTPLILQLTIGAVVEFPVGEMMLQVAMIVLVPAALGQLGRRLLGARLAPWLSALVRLAQTLILLFVYTGVSAAALHLTGRAGLIVRFFATAAVLHVALVAFTFQASTLLGLSAANRTAVVFCGAQKTLPNGIYLWDRFFPANPYGAIALVAYHVFQLVLDTLLVPWLGPGRGRVLEAEEALVD
jgi:predicted Na+-dependent transporter